MLTDTHLHLNRDEFSGDLDEVMARARQAGVTRFLNVGYDLASSEASVTLAEGDPAIMASVGVHPHDALDLADAEGRLTAAGTGVLARLEELASRPSVVAVGEIGLDYFRDLSPRPAQHAALRAQLALADRLDLPVILHIRDAYDEALGELERHGLPARRGVLHAFAGDERVAEWAAERGFLLGIGGPVTYKTSRLPAVLSRVTARDVILETDAPWLPPVPHRGQRNEPSYLALTAARVAGIFGLDMAEFAEQMRVNLERMLGLEVSP